ncbi:MAG: 3-hydroxyacyl-CoA dehydrogenase, partial [Microbacteriaceae bacterium]|nr:3-hydroxyacyl-CoA dehydrogenase [Burkholderiaceae bacterium]
EQQWPTLDSAEVVLLLGLKAGASLAGLPQAAQKTAIVVELHGECLGEYTGESAATEGSDVLGFARFRLGDGPASNLIELVRQPGTTEAALAAAKQVFESAGFKVAVCLDFQGRIIDRLVRPYYNAALRRLDEGLATATDMDLTLQLRLGYPKGPIALLEQTGLAHHYDVTQNLFERLGDPAYVPARRAQVAKRRAGK